MTMDATVTRKLLDRLLYTCIRGFFKMLGQIPPPTTRKLGNVLGDLGFGLDARHRRIVLDNLKLAFGGNMDRQQRRAMARSVYHHLGQILFEIAWSFCNHPQVVHRRITVEGIHHFLDAHAHGKGVLLLTGHIGNWELLSFVGDRTTIPINVVYRRMDFKPLNRFFEMLRSRFGARMIHSGRAMPKILKALRKGEAVFTLMDQSVDWYDGVWVDFFGHPACTSKGLALIAMKTRSPVLPTFMVREKNGFRAVFEAPISLTLTGDKTMDVYANTQAYTRAIERVIRRHPEQWFWVHRRWKRKPYCSWPRRQA